MPLKSIKLSHGKKRQKEDDPNRQGVKMESLGSSKQTKNNELRSNETLQIKDNSDNETRGETSDPTSNKKDASETKEQVTKENDKDIEKKGETSKPPSRKNTSESKMKKIPSGLPPPPPARKVLEAKISEMKPSDEPPPKWWKCCYDSQNKTVCYRNGKSWLYIMAYSIMYMLFLITYTLIFLYVSLQLVKLTDKWNISEKSELVTFSDNGVGLSAVPTSDDYLPVIWYNSGDTKRINNYVGHLDKFLASRGGKRKKRETRNDLGPCGVTPYGYGKEPCIIVKVNKQIGWSAKPLERHSEEASKVPREVRKWMKRERKLWLHCGGFYPWDREHIGKINYYPDPPGVNPDSFPMNMTSESPLIAVQFSNFTLGMSLAIQCQLWYAQGPSSISFVLYVAPQEPQTNINKIVYR